MFSVFPVYCRLVVSTSAIDYLERLVSKMTCYVSGGTLNPTHSITFRGDSKGDVTAGPDRCTSSTTERSFDLCQLKPVLDGRISDTELAVFVTSGRIHATCPAPIR